MFGLVCSAATQGTQGRGCANNGDCNDGYDCTVNVCLNLRCSTLVMDPTPTGCCNTIADCFPPQAPCTSVVCDPTLGNQCVYSGGDGCDPGFSSASNPFLSSFPVYVPAATPGVEPSEGEEPEEPAYSPFPSFSTVFLPSAPPSLQIPTVSTLTPLTTFVTLDTPPDPLLQPIPDFTTIKLPSAPPSLQLATARTLSVNVDIFSHKHCYFCMNAHTHTHLFLFTYHLAPQRGLRSISPASTLQGVCPGSGRNSAPAVGSRSLPKRPQTSLSPGGAIGSETYWLFLQR